MEEIGGKMSGEKQRRGGQLYTTQYGRSDAIYSVLCTIEETAHL